MNPFNGGWVILASLFVAMLLGVVHLPETWPQWLGWLRPNWLILVVFFWVIELPHRLGLIAAWIIGLLADALFAMPLGFNAFVLAGVTYIAWRFFERLRMYSVIQQCGVIFALVFTAEVLAVFAQYASANEWSWQLIFVPVVSTVVWPFVYLLLIRIRTGVRVE
jgi:rod shape-determining protein MreD